MDEKLEKRLEHFCDVVEIEQLLNKYVYELMTMDFDVMFDDLFTQTRDDVSIQASDSGVFIGKEKIKETFFPIFMGYLKTVPGSFTMHLTTNPLIEISEDGKYARSVAPSPGCATDPTVKEALWIWGTFLDDYVKENGEWRILHHAFVPLFRTPYDKGWTKQAIGAQLSKIAGKWADGPSQYWNPYDVLKAGDEIWASLPKARDLSKMDFDK